MERRKFIKTSLIGAAGMGLLGGIYSWQIEPFWVEFVHRKMPIKNLPQHLEGKTLIQISDMHIGNRFNYQYIIDSLKKAQNLNPDYVVYTGDFINYEDKEQFTQLREVLKGAAMGNLGTIAILGNHDYGKEWSEQEVADNVKQELTEAGITVLCNEISNKSDLNFIGLDDYWAINFNPKSILNNHNPEIANIVLCHNPDVCDLDVWNGYQGWILSGHTHGGQCKPPFLPAPILPIENKSYAQGEVNLGDGRMLYVNRALGHLWQLRFNVRPEVTVFKLNKA
jgi:hypothetical protein